MRQLIVKMSGASKTNRSIDQAQIVARVGHVTGSDVMNKQSEVSIFLKLALAGAVLGMASLHSVHAAFWTAGGPLNLARYYHTATLLSNGKVLVAGGNNDSGSSLASAELYDPAVGTWTATRDMSEARVFHTATALTNGLILVAGGSVYDYGWDSGVRLASAELFNPATGTWTSTGPLINPRSGHTATLLLDGRVLVAGGDDGNESLYSAELYDPTTGTWSSTGDLNMARAWHTATLLTNGMVLVAGGSGPDGPLDSAELFDPASGSWTVTSSAMSDRRYLHTATLLPNGQVLVAGGYEQIYNGVTTNTELFDPNTETWTATSTPLNVQRAEHTATLLANGQVMVTGGYYGSPYSTVLVGTELYNPDTGVWTFTNSLYFGRGSHTATLLTNGQVVIAGGVGVRDILSSTEIYNPTRDPDMGTWMAAKNMTTAREFHTATLLRNGKVLIAGGMVDLTGRSTDGAEIYDPTKGDWVRVHHMAVARNYFTATLLTNGKVLVAGGFRLGYSLPTSTAELFDPFTRIWTKTRSMSASRAYYTATLLPDGRVLVAGGNDGTNSLSSAELFDPASGTWKNARPMNSPRSGHTATLLPNGKVLVTGGESDYPQLAELFNPATGTWTSSFYTGDWGGHTATLLPNLDVLFAGGSTPYQALPLAEQYDPANGTWVDVNNLATERGAHSATLLPSGKVLVAGGEDFSLYFNQPVVSAELFNPDNGTWADAGAMMHPRWGHTATLLPNGNVLIAGGFDHTNFLASAEIYCPAKSAMILSGASRIANGTFQFAFAGLPNRTYIVLSSTKLNSPLSSWTKNGAAREFSPGLFVFNNSQATNGSQWFYRVYAP
jgi:WD40 repeat protein